jgi:hypothetical protein
MISDLARARSWRLRTVMRQWFVSSVQSVWWLTGSTTAAMVEDLMLKKYRLEDLDKISKGYLI